MKEVLNLPYRVVMRIGIFNRVPEIVQAGASIFRPRTAQPRILYSLEEMVGSTFCRVSNPRPLSAEAVKLATTPQ